MYSPASLKVAVVVALPPSALSIDGFAFSNTTAPGPRNLLHEMDSGGGGGIAAPDELRPRPRHAGGGSGTWILSPSSFTELVSVTGSVRHGEWTPAIPD